MSDLASQAARRARRDPGLGGDLADALEVVNEAHLVLCDSDEPWDFLEREGTFIAGSGVGLYTLAEIAAVAFPSAWIQRVRELVDDTTGGMPLAPGDWLNLERLAGSTAENDAGGRPRFWATWALGSDQARLRIWPPPAAATTLRAFARLGAVVLTGAQFPLLPAAHARSVLIPYAAARLWEGRGGTESMRMAQSFDAAHERGLAALRLAHGAAREPDLRLMEETFSHDLPGGGTLAREGWAS